MIEKLRSVYSAMLREYTDGLSSTSTTKFDAIKKLFHEEFKISIEEIYATGAGTRPGNLEVRLSQGVQATKHTVLGLAFLIDDMNTEENRTKLTNSTYTTVTKFLGRGKSSYENILILIQSNNSLFVTGLISSSESELSNILKSQLNISDVRYLKSATSSSEPTSAYNKIYYGAPGTGKSYKIEKILKNLDKKYWERISFHPDFDHNAFVGGYKPISETVKYKDNDGKGFIKDEIKYKFVPQTFTNIYVRAWKDLKNKYYLAIEEINRGNCAEIFGEIFQLLDRNSNYSVSPSEELKKHLIDELGETHEGYKNGLKLPHNLNLLATMNTSDQSLFPMDSAFKRRWSWEYIPICYLENNEDETINPAFNYIVTIDSSACFKWIDFIKNVNLRIKSNPNLGMDKCVGNYFVNPEQNEILLEEFINKVIFYLWNDVFKDEENNVFPKEITYEDFFPIRSNGVLNLNLLLKNIEIIPTTPNQNRNEDSN
jgi:hypothetical protein